MVYNIMTDGTVRESMAGVEIDLEAMPELYEAITRIARKEIDKSESI